MNEYYEILSKHGFDDTTISEVYTYSKPKDLLDALEIEYAYWKSEPVVHYGIRTTMISSAIV